MRPFLTYSILIAAHFLAPVWSDAQSTNRAPIIVHTARATPNPVTGDTAALSVLADDDGGEANLVYTWKVVAQPPGGTATFSKNHSNAAKNSIAKFYKAGTYSLVVTVSDRSGLTATSIVSVPVVFAAKR